MDKEELLNLLSLVKMILLGLTEFIPGGLRWIKSFPTKKFGTTNVQIPLVS